jgi:hypothetical protein
LACLAERESVDGKRRTQRFEAMTRRGSFPQPHAGGRSMLSLRDSARGALIDGFSASESGLQEVVVVVREPRDRRKSSHELVLLQMIAKEIVFKGNELFIDVVDPLPKVGLAVKAIQLAENFINRRMQIA